MCQAQSELAGLGAVAATELLEQGSNQGIALAAATVAHQAKLRWHEYRACPNLCKNLVAAIGRQGRSWRAQVIAGSSSQQQSAAFSNNQQHS